MQSEAGKRPSLPFLPPMHGSSSVTSPGGNGTAGRDTSGDGGGRVIVPSHGVERGPDTVVAVGAPTVGPVLLRHAFCMC